MKAKLGVRIDRLVKLREEHGWSQRELARRCGLSDSMVQKYETLISDPTAHTVVALADQLGVSTDYLLGVTDDPRLPIQGELLDGAEQQLLETYRRRGWHGIAQLGLDELAKASTKMEKA